MEENDVENNENVMYGQKCFCMKAKNDMSLEEKIVVLKSYEIMLLTEVEDVRKRIAKILGSLGYSEDDLR